MENCLKRWEYQTILPDSWETSMQVKKQQLEPGWFKMGKIVHQVLIFLLCLFNFHAEYIMRNAGLDESQAVIKIARNNINNLR